MPGQQQTKKALIVVRTYPTPAVKGVEVSCTAAITDRGEWLRLFPIPYRFLSQDRRFRKYQWIEVRVTKASDPRPESYKLDVDSIKILSDPLSTADGWRARKEIVLPLRSHSLCYLQRERNSKRYPTLGFFRPKVIKRLIIKPDSKPWTQGQLQILSQMDLYKKAPQKALEKVPYSFRYQFRCDESSCTGHTISCIDWEMSESWRKWKDKYGNKWEDKFLQKYQTEMIEKNDTHFYVGTVHQHPQTWIIVGLFYPPRSIGHVPGEEYFTSIANG